MAVFHINNSDNVRLSSTSVTSQHAALNIDFYDGYYVAEIMEMKTGDDIGNVISSERVEVECQVRIDRNPVFTPTCTFNDDNTTWFVTLGKGLGDRFIEEMESGSTLRIKLLDGKDAIYVQKGHVAYERDRERERQRLLQRRHKAVSLESSKPAQDQGAAAPALL